MNVSTIQAGFGLLKLEPSAIAAHTGCRLGKWYYEGEGRECFSKLPGYRELEAPHIEVHKHGIAAIQARLAQDENGLLQHVAAMESNSLEVIACLDRMAVAAVSNPAILCAR